MLEEPSSVDRREVPVVSEYFVAGSASALSQDPKSASLETEVLDCLRMMELLGSQRVATNASCGARYSATLPTTLLESRKTVPYINELLLCVIRVHKKSKKTKKVKSLDDRRPP